MATSAVGICNLALAHLKVDQPIVSIQNPSDATEEAFARWYDIVRREALRMHSWNFARKRAQLNQATTQPAFGDVTAYNLPGDYIRLVSIVSNTALNTVPLGNAHFTIEGDDILVNNLVTESQSGVVLNIIYINDFTQTTKMTSDFQILLSLMLAERLSYLFTQSNSADQRIRSKLDEQILHVKSREGQENPPKVVQRIPSRMSRGLSDRNDLVVFN